ncbi:MAG: hypothetical protein KF819_40355 [Labilithrix sp.]|nr:hypothetical protein [Labilithrix sp.]
MAIQNPTIIIPGIKGSSLENVYALDPSPLWSEIDAAKNMLFGPSLKALALDPTARFDHSLDVVTQPNGVLPLAYSTLASGLRERRSLPVYVFPYDWRYSIERAAERLAEQLERFVAKVGAHTPGWSRKIDFVCHSMGGLVFRSMLSKIADPSRIGRVVFLAVPHRGSVDAVEAMIRGETTLFGGRKESRKLARTFPGVYELLPRFAGAVVDAASDQPLDVFDMKNWQRNVTPQDLVEKHGFDVEQSHLTEAKRVLEGLPDPTTIVPASEMLTIYGAREKSTMTKVRVGAAPEHDYDFKNAQKSEGDGVVPVQSALFPKIPAVKLTWDDVSYFTETTAALSFHAFIGTLDETGTIVSRFLEGASTPADILPRGLPASRYEASPA